MECGGIPFPPWGEARLTFASVILNSKSYHRFHGIRPEAASAWDKPPSAARGPTVEPDRPLRARVVSKKTRSRPYPGALRGKGGVGERAPRPGSSIRRPEALGLSDAL